MERMDSNDFYIPSNQARTRLNNTNNTDRNDRNDRDSPEERPNTQGYSNTFVYCLLGFSIFLVIIVVYLLFSKKPEQVVTTGPGPGPGPVHGSGQTQKRKPKSMPKAEDLPEQKVVKNRELIDKWSSARNASAEKSKVAERYAPRNESNSEVPEEARLHDGETDEEIEEDDQN